MRDVQENRIGGTLLRVQGSAAICLLLFLSAGSSDVSALRATHPCVSQRMPYQPMLNSRGAKDVLDRMSHHGGSECDGRLGQYPHAAN